jgi:hypothetical protein
MSKRKLSGSAWQKKNEKKLLVTAGAGHMSIQQFMLPFNVPPSSSADVSNTAATAAVSLSDHSDNLDVVEPAAMTSSTSQPASQPAYYRFVDNSAKLSDCGIPLDDFGYAVKIQYEGIYTLTEWDVHHFLKNRWKPNKKEDFPVSYHTKKGTVRPRSINANHFDQFPWLAISRLESHKGAWCAVCVLFKTSDEGGGRSGTGQRMGRLVRTPLIDYSDLTGKSGALTAHCMSGYHKNCADRASHFIRQYGQPALDIRNQLNTTRMHQVCISRIVCNLYPY